MRFSPSALIVHRAFHVHAGLHQARSVSVQSSVDCSLQVGIMSSSMEPCVLEPCRTPCGSVFVCFSCFQIVSPQCFQNWLVLIYIHFAPDTVMKRVRNVWASGCQWTPAPILPVDCSGFLSMSGGRRFALVRFS